MKRPKFINVSGQRYKIKFDLADPDAYGLTTSDTNTIQLRPDIPEDKLLRVLTHEITHAVIFETPFSTRKCFDVEEICDIIGYHFLNVLRDNPELVTYLLHEIEQNDDEEDAVKL